MPEPTVPFKVLADGYEISGNNTDGFRATVPYLVAWADAFVFADDVMGSSRATQVGPITYRQPYAFPSSVARLYAESFSIRPIGVNGDPPTPTLGLKPGEFFQSAKVVVTFATPKYSSTTLDSPLNQLDPENPITLCEQSIKMGGKMRSRKGSGYVYTDNTALAGEIAVPEKEARLSLAFPKVPYLPWQLIQPYIGRLNSVPVLGCATGTLIFEGGETKYTILSDGTAGSMLVLEFTWQEIDWNKQVRPDTGEWDYVYKKGHAGDANHRIFQYKDFRELFLKYQGGA